LNFDYYKIQITNTNGNSDVRTVLMFFDPFDQYCCDDALFGFYKYDVIGRSNSNKIGYNSVDNFYAPDIAINNDNWYHLGAVMTGTGNMVGNKIYINGKNLPLSWIEGNENGLAVFQNYIVLGSWMNDDYEDHTYSGYESQIYYFDREL